MIFIIIVIAITVIIISPRMANPPPPPPPTPAFSGRRSQPPLNVPEAVGAHHMFQLFWTVPEKGQPFKSPDRGMAPIPAEGPSMTSPSPHCIYKGSQRAGRSMGRPREMAHASKKSWLNTQTNERAGRSESIQLWPTAYPPSFLVHRGSAGTLALREVLSKTPSKLLPPYPCIGHHSPPSLSAVKFRKAPSPDQASRSHPWPSNRPAC